MRNGPGRPLERLPLSPSNDHGADIIGSCGADAANGLVRVTTTPGSGFSNNYNKDIALDGNGDFQLVDPNWRDNRYGLNLNCSDVAGNRTLFGPLGSLLVDVPIPVMNLHGLWVMVFLMMMVAGIQLRVRKLNT